MPLAEPPLLRVPMSYEEWLALPEHPRNEFVDGTAILMGDPHPDHSRAQLNLSIALKTTLRGVEVNPVVAVALPRNRVRVPDISVFGERPATNPVTLTPLLVVEVVSPSTRSEDLLRKSRDYARARIAQYWLVDPDNRSIEVLGLADEEEWTTLLVLDDEHPRGQVDLGEHGTVLLDLAAILDG